MEWEAGGWSTKGQEGTRILISHISGCGFYPLRVAAVVLGAGRLTVALKGTPNLLPLDAPLWDTSVPRSLSHPFGPPSVPPPLPRPPGFSHRVIIYLFIIDLLGTLSVWSWEAALERPAQVSCRPRDAICPHFCHSAVKTRASCLPLICPQRGSLGLASPWLQPLPVRSFFWQWALLSAGRFTGGLRSSPPAP